MHFHVLGVGSIGTLIAYHLRRSLPSSNTLTLILKRSNVRHGSFPLALVVESNGVRNKVTGFQSEIVDPVQENALQLLGSSSSAQNHENSPIQSLFVATKAPSTVAAIRLLQHRITPSTTIVLLQNGMGVYEAVVRSLFPNPAFRPHFILASTTHGVWKQNKITNAHSVVHAGIGELIFGIVPDSRVDSRDFEHSFWTSSQLSQPSDASLSLDDIESESNTESPISESPYRSLRATVAALHSLIQLNPTWLPIADMQIRLRQKLTVNCSINPITALIGCRNGDLYANPYASILIRNICREAATVFRAVAHASKADGASDWLFSGGRTPQGGMQKLSAKALEWETNRVLKVTSANYSSMLLDMDRGNELEINFMNGYLGELGQSVHMHTPTIAAIRDAVLLKASLRKLGHMV